MNILTGARDHVTKYLAEHQNVDAVCYFGSAGGRKFAHLRSEREEDLGGLRAGEDWAEETPGGGVSVQVKNVWLAMGDIFVN